MSSACGRTVASQRGGHDRAMERRTLLTGFAATGPQPWWGAAATTTSRVPRARRRRLRPRPPRPGRPHERRTEDRLDDRHGPQRAVGHRVPRERRRPGVAARRGVDRPYRDGRQGHQGRRCRRRIRWGRGRGWPARVGPGTRRRVDALRVRLDQVGRPGRTTDPRRRLDQVAEVDPHRHRRRVPSSRRAPAVRRRRRPLRVHRRRRQRSARAGQGLAQRQDPAHHPRRQGRARATRSATARGPTGIATSRVSPTTRTAGCGPRSSATRRPTSSTSSKRGGNYGWPGVEGTSDEATWSTPRSRGAPTSARRPAWRSPGRRRSSGRCRASACSPCRSTGRGPASPRRTSAATTDASAA